ncbi:MAG: TIGR04255 family protein [Betaproteobacteria bacterium]
MPDYANPPVSEVACGISFEPLKRFLIPHIGLYWTRIRDAFPTCEHAVPYSPNPSGEPGWIDAASGLPLPRSWFIAPNKDRLVQLQGDCFFYNWRRLSDADVYPRYNKLIGEYRALLDSFLVFLEETRFPAPSVTTCELTYVNHIPQEHGWTSPADLSKVFKDYCWAQKNGRYLPSPKHATWRVRFDMPDDHGNLTVNVVPAKRVKDEMPTLKLEITAKTKMAGKPVAETTNWFDIAHEWIVRGFADLTQDDFQRTAWKRLNG